MEHLPSSHPVLHNTNSKRLSGSTTANLPKTLSLWRPQRSSSGTQRSDSPYHFPPLHPTPFVKPPSHSLSVTYTEGPPFPQPPASAFQTANSSGDITTINTLPRLFLPANKSLPTSQAKSCGGSHSPPSPSSSTTTISGHDPLSTNPAPAKPGSKRPRSWELKISKDSSSALPPRLSYKSPFQCRAPFNQEPVAPHSPRNSPHQPHSVNTTNPAASCAAATSRPLKTRILSHPLSPTSDDNLSTHVAFEDSSLRNSSSGDNKHPLDGPTPTSSPNIPPRPHSPAAKASMESGSGGDDILASAQQQQQEGGLLVPLQQKSSSNVAKLLPGGKVDEGHITCQEAGEQGSGLVPMQLDELAQIGALVNMGMLKLTAATRKALAASLAAQQASSDDDKLQALRTLLEGPSPSPFPSLPSTLPPTSTIHRHQLDCTPDPSPPETSLPGHTNSTTPATLPPPQAATSATTVSTLTVSQDTITDPNGSGAVTLAGAETVDSADVDKDTQQAEREQSVDSAPLKRTTSITAANAQNPQTQVSTRSKKQEGKLPGQNGNEPKLSTKTTTTTGNLPSPKSHPLRAPSPACSPRATSPPLSKDSAQPKPIHSHTGPSPDPAASVPEHFTVPHPSAFHRLASDPDLHTMLTLGVKNFERYAPPAGPFGYSFAPPTHPTNTPAFFSYNPAHAVARTIPSEGLAPQLLIIPPSAATPWPTLSTTSLSFLPPGCLIPPMTMSLPLLHPPSNPATSPRASTALSQPPAVPQEPKGIKPEPRVIKPDPRAEGPTADEPGGPIQALPGGYLRRGGVQEEDILNLRDTVLAVVYNQKELDATVKVKQPPAAFGGDLKLWAEFLQQLEQSRAFTHHLLRETANLYSPPEEPAPSPTNNSFPPPPPTLSRTSPPPPPTYTSAPPPLPATITARPPTEEDPTPTPTYPAPTHKRHTPKWFLPMVSPEAPSRPSPTVFYDGYWTPPPENFTSFTPSPSTGSKSRASASTQATLSSGRKGNYTPKEAAKNLPRINPQPSKTTAARIPSATTQRIPAVAPSHPFGLSSTPSGNPTAAPSTSPSHPPTLVPTVAIPTATARPAGCLKPADLYTPAVTSAPAPTSIKPGHIVRDTEIFTPMGPTPTLATPCAPAPAAVPSPLRKRILSQHATLTDPPAKRTRLDTAAQGADAQERESGQQEVDLSTLHPKRRAKKWSQKSGKATTPDASCSSISAAGEVADDADAVEGLLQLAGSMPLI